MAEIFRGKAVAAGGFEKPVAIKRILPHLSQDTRFVELLIAEAKVLSLLKHRNIVQIFDVGLGDDGQYFLVMEYVDGKDLGAVQRALEAQAPAHAVRPRAPHRRRDLRGARARALRARRPTASRCRSSIATCRRRTCCCRAPARSSSPTSASRSAPSRSRPAAARCAASSRTSRRSRRATSTLDPRSDVFSVGDPAVGAGHATGGCSRGSAISRRCARCARRRCRRPTEVDPRLSPGDRRAADDGAGARSRSAGRPPASSAQKLRSLRYSLEVTVGDPATELAKIIDTAEQVERQSQQFVARRTLAAASMVDEHTEAHRDPDPHRRCVLDARQGRTRSSRRAPGDRSVRGGRDAARAASGDQLRMLRSAARPRLGRDRP